MDISLAPTPADLGDVVAWRARAEWFEVARMLDYRDAEMARTASIESGRLRQVERSSIPLTIAEATHLSEGQVLLRLSAADRVRDQTPAVWEAFSHGTLDWAKVRDIAATIDKLHRAESIHRLERLVVGYAAEHTPAELRTWLRRFVQRVEADLATERAETERRNRHVSITQGDDSMSWLNAYLPSHEAAAIEQRLHTEARRPSDDTDDRTVHQREADLLVACCLESDAGTSAVDANIAVTIDADVLAGAVPGFAESADGRWAVPAAWIATMVASGNTFWHRIVTHPVAGDVLTHEYLGRFAPDILDIALQYLHEVCQAPGCMVPARRCDIDHREPWPQGPTRADNLGPLCRRHHTMKGHGILHWTTQPNHTSERSVA
jgi:hypothetical protein